jgi:hypothetical protein
MVHKTLPMNSELRIIPVKTKKSRTKLLRVEHLESRQLMAGDVSAVLQNGNLLLTEAPGQLNQENSVEISKLSNGMIRVTGGSHVSDKLKSKINGQEFQDFSVTGDLSVRLAGGSDKVTFSNGGIGLSGAPRFKNVSIDVASPTNSTVRDADLVSIRSLNVTGSLTVKTGADNDSVTMLDSPIAPVKVDGDLRIETGAGTDTVKVERNLSNVIGKNVAISTFDSLTEAESDLVTLKGVAATQSINVSTGGGNDTISLINTKARITGIDAGAGNDTGVMDGTHATDTLFAAMGDGDDTLSLRNIHPITHMVAFIDGGKGWDSLYTSNVDNLASQFSLTSWERLNGRILASLNANNFSKLKSA